MRTLYHLQQTIDTFKNVYCNCQNQDFHKYGFLHQEAYIVYYSPHVKYRFVKKHNPSYWVQCIEEHMNPIKIL